MSDSETDTSGSERPGKSCNPGTPGSRLGVVAVAVSLAMLLAACSGEGGDEGSAPDGTVVETTSPTPADGVAYEPPEQHASDWGAPPVELPEAPLPYGPSPQATADPAFYDVTTLDPSEVAAAETGDVLRSEQVELTGALEGASGWRILYRSTDADDHPAVVSGMILVPESPAPEAGRPVAAWAHGTTGVADRCAPSSRGDLFYEDYGRMGRNLLDAGFVVAATDYHGLGTPGLHTYHGSEEMGRAVIDSVIAAHSFDEAGPLTDDWLTVGHSQGGLAVLATDERVERAPEELDYLGSVVAAPSAEVAPVAPAMFMVPERGYGVLFLAGASTVEPRLDPAVSLGAEAATRQALFTHGCWEEAVPGFEDIPSEEILSGPEIGELLATVLQEYASYDPARITGPLLVVHGEEDLSLPIELTQEVVGDLCAAGVAVDFRTYPGSGHDEVVAASWADSATWMAARLAGKPPVSTCGSGN